MAESILDQEMQIKRSGTLTYALQDDAHAKEFLQKVGGDDLPMATVPATSYIPCTLSSVVQKWLGRSGGSIQVLKYYREVLTPLGIYTINDFDEAKPALVQLGVDVRFFKGLFNGTGVIKPFFVGYRIVLLTTLNSWTAKGEALRQVMSIKSSGVEELLHLGGYEHLLKLKPIEEKSVSVPKPKLEVVQTTRSSGGEDLLALLSDDAKLMELKGRLQPQIDTLNAQIEKLAAERDEHQKLISRIDLLLGF